MHAVQNFRQSPKEITMDFPQALACTALLFATQFAVAQDRVPKA